MPSPDTLELGVPAEGRSREPSSWPLRHCWPLASPVVGTAEAVRVTAGLRSTHAVALTFDDGYRRSACASIARTLRAYGATGTFFVNGVHLAAAPAAWRDILAGQQVGNHTRSHLRLTKQSDQVVRRQIARNEALHERILGRPMLKVLRPPYGAQDARVRRIAGRARLQSNRPLERRYARLAAIDHGALHHRPGHRRAPWLHHPHALRSRGDAPSRGQHHPALPGAGHHAGRAGRRPGAGRARSGLSVISRRLPPVPARGRRGCRRCARCRRTAG